MKPVRALVITGFGINCQDELAAAYRLAGGYRTLAACIRGERTVEAVTATLEP